MRNLTLILLTIIFGTFCNFAQDDQNKYVPHDFSKIPPSPEVASLMKYIDFPVSYFTGQPDINIPIYTLTEGELTIPISISYHGGGIKVNEHPGIIGMGWTLIAGGSVSRTVYGLPDEMYSNIGTVNELRGIFRLNNKDKTLRNLVINRNSLYNPGLAKSDALIENGRYCDDYDGGKVDMANDMLNFNAMGMSGTFIMNETDRSITLSTSSPIKISTNFNGPLPAYPDTFTITDNMNIRYIFGEKEKTRYEYSYFSGGQSVSDSLQYTSAWHLTQITNLYHDNVYFNYSESRFKSLDNGPYNFYAYARDRGGLPDISVKTGSTVYYYPKSLTSIEGKSVIIRFHYDANYDMLESITVHRNDANNTIIKEFEFIHEMKTLGVKTKTFLSQINELASGKRITLYKFNYFEGSTLGKEYSYAQDHWGYYNGKVNKTLMCEFGNEMGLASTNREVNLNCTKIGSLSSIIYPTGGTTSFDWELNDYSHIKDMLIPPVTGTDSIFSKYTLSGISQCENLQTPLFTPPNDYMTYIHIDMSRYIKILMDGGSGMSTWDEYYRYHIEPSTWDPNIPQVQIIKKNSNGTESIVERFFIDKKTSDKGTHITFVETGSKYYVKLLNPRNFTNVDPKHINGYFGNGSEAHCYETGYVPIDIKSIKRTDLGHIKKWGGLRIKSITSDSNNDQICKKYEYKTNLSGKGYSSGVVQMEPDYDYETIKGKVVVNLPASGVELKVLSFKCSTSNGLYSTPLGGAKVEYPEVWEYYSGNNMENIKIGYIYTSLMYFPDILDVLFETYIPGGSRMMTSYAHQRGVLSQKLFYRSNNTLYKNIYYYYNIFEGISPLFTGQFSQIADFTRVSTDPPIASDYTVSRYRLIPYNKLLSSEITADYDSYGDEIYTDSIEYTYFSNGYSNSPNHSLVRSIRRKNSHGEFVTTYYSYYQPSGSSHIDLKETEVTVINGKIVSAKRMEYDMHLHRIRKVYSIAANTPVLATYQLGSGYSACTALLNAINIPEYQYEYDGRGNLVQISYNGEILASYLWGYNGMYPILEAKGVGISELLSNLSSLGISSSETLSDMTDDTRISNLLNQLRTKFPGKDLITMTYHWLIGVSTATDSRGVTTHFTFDDFGRLKDVKDYNGYFIRKYDYHYAGQQ